MQIAEVKFGGGTASSSSDLLDFVNAVHVLMSWIVVLGTDILCILRLLPNSDSTILSKQPTIVKLFM